MSGTLDFVTLKDKQRAIREGFPETMGLRVHRAISWIGCAEKSSENDDARFLFLWIAFNAAYADEQKFHSVPPAERTAFNDYFTKLIALDNEKHIHKALWHNFSGPIRVIMNNRYVFSPFWQHHNGIEGAEDWENRFKYSVREFESALKRGDCVKILSFVFDRLYVLRNQLIHGGATWNSNVNRDQVRDGAAILGFLLPVFVDIMMDNPSDEWGKPFYPVVE